MQTTLEEGEGQKVDFLTWNEAVAAATDRVDWRRQVNGLILTDENY